MIEQTVESSERNWYSGDAELEQLFCQGAMLQHNAIARRAYQSFVSRGFAHGLDLEDWLDAEREIVGAR